MSPDDFDKGAGGSENLALRFTRALASQGHQVTMYCHCDAERCVDGVEWRQFTRGAWMYAPTDVLVAFRKLDVLAASPPTALRIALLADRLVPGLEDAVRRRVADVVVFVSEFQLASAGRLLQMTPPANWVVWPAFGTELADYDQPVAKVPGRCHYASAPYRGLDRLLDLWPQIRARCPHATLHSASSYLHWGRTAAENASLTSEIYPRLQAMRPLGVVNRQRLGRADLVSLQLSSELLLYPAFYDETFCVTALEASAAGAVVVADCRGALSERVRNGVTGYAVDTSTDAGRARFVDHACNLLEDHVERARLASAGRRAARAYDYAEIAHYWASALESCLSDRSGVPRRFRHA